MDEEKYWEQPEDLTLDDAQQSEVEENAEGSQIEVTTGDKSEAENGETVGKFKDVTALLEAYNNLERNSQKNAKDYPP